MTTLRINLTDQRTAYVPGEAITGTVHWTGGSAPRALELRLFWFTQGKGTQDVGVVKRLPIPVLADGEVHPFDLRAPAHPPSCSGKLVSIVWALELVATPAASVPRSVLVIAPGGRELRLGIVGP
jgi:hypothetical protein